MEHREALEAIAALDYKNGAVNCAAYEAVKIARAALESVPASKPVLHALMRSNGSGFVTYDGLPIVSENPVAPFESGQLQVPLYAAPISDPQAQRAETARLDWLLPNLHPANFGLDYDAEKLDDDHNAEFRRAIDLDIEADAARAQRGHTHG